jgi:hypothetical protein
MQRWSSNIGITITGGSIPVACWFYLFMPNKNNMKQQDLLVYKNLLCSTSFKHQHAKVAQSTPSSYWFYLFLSTKQLYKSTTETGAVLEFTVQWCQLVLLIPANQTII